jgi:hypothetical protein
MRTINRVLSKAVEKIGQKGPNSVRNLPDLNYVSDADNHTIWVIEEKQEEEKQEKNKLNFQFYTIIII